MPLTSRQHGLVGFPVLPFFCPGLKPEQLFWLFAAAAALLRPGTC